MVKRATVLKKAKDKKKEKQLPPIHCKGCGTLFIPKTRREHYHSASCRESYYQRTYYSKASARKTCPNCGSEFVTSKPGRQDYCSPECREDHKRKVRDGLAASITAERMTFLGDRFATLENAHFKCELCGKGVQDGVKLDVEEDGGGGFRAVCSMCVEGREFNNDNARKQNSLKIPKVSNG